MNAFLAENETNEATYQSSTEMAQEDCLVAETFLNTFCERVQKVFSSSFIENTNQFVS